MSRARKTPAAAPVARWRLSLALGVFLACFTIAGLRVVQLGVDSAGNAGSVRQAEAKPAADRPLRADIVDRNGRLMATVIPMWTLYAHPREIADPAGTARALAGIFPELDAGLLGAELGKRRSFAWVRKRLTPAEKAGVAALGIPGLYFGARSMRYYPGGMLAAHILGGVRVDAEAVDRAQLVGVSGVERRFDRRLRTESGPLQLSVDMRLQAVLHRQVAHGMKRYRAEKASAVLMDVKSGEVLGMVSLPDYDPNRPLAAGEDARLNLAAHGVFEPGSVLKPLTAALAMEHGNARLSTRYGIQKPLSVGRVSLREPTIRDETVTLLEAVTRSSNIATATAALAVGPETQKAFLGQLGMLAPTGLELGGAENVMPLYPESWGQTSTATIAFGHGIAVTPVHLAAAYATLTGDGRRVSPTLLAGPEQERGARVVSPKTVRSIRLALRNTVRKGTGRRAAVPGYAVGGKTGTADMVNPDGRYHTDRVVSTFASVFPAYDPAYVLVVSMYNPRGIGKDRYRRSAGRTAAPVAAEVITRVAPLLGIAPVAEVFANQEAPGLLLARY